MKNILFHLMGDLKEVSPLQHHGPYLFQRLSELVETLSRQPATILPGFRPIGGASLSINPVFYSIMSLLHSSSLNDSLKKKKNEGKKSCLMDHV